MTLVRSKFSDGMFVDAGGPDPLTPNNDLAPVLTRFAQIRPRSPAFQGDGEKFVSHTIPYLQARIGEVWASRISKAQAWPDRQPGVSRLHDYGAGDPLVVFEGATGGTPGKAPAWSPMGFVMARQVAAGWIAHVVFRGSRSGWAAREVAKATDNPDWVTDLDATKVAKPIFSPEGKVAQGFAIALEFCFPTILAALGKLHELKGTPRRFRCR